MSHDGQCSLYAGVGACRALSSVWLAPWLAEYSREGQARSQRARMMRRGTTVDSVQRDDPAHGDWCVDGRELNVWVDASSLAIGVALERHETVLSGCDLKTTPNILTKLNWTPR